MILARTIQLAVLTLLLAIPAAALEAFLRARVFTQGRDVLPVILTRSLLYSTLFSAAVCALWVVVFRSARGRLRPGRSAGLASLIAFGPPLLLFAYRINQDLLPGLLELESLVWNAVILGLGAALLLGSSGLLRRWQEGAWEQGRLPLLGLGVLLLAPLGVYLAGPRGARDPAPDILVILLDVLRADALSCYGYERPTSPNIDALSADGILFEQVISASTYTKTSIASLFTGLAAHHHGVYTGTHGGGAQDLESDLLSDDFVTVAEALYQRGMNTSAWVQNAHVRDYLGYAQGFTFYADQPGDVEVIADGYLRWKDEWGHVAPSFTYLHILDIHGPYDPPAPFLGKFADLPDSPLGALTSSDASAWTDFKQEVRRGDLVLTEADLGEMRARYDELVAYVDHWVGRIVDDLKATGRYDNTLIMVLSDHGEGFWEHEFISHSVAPFEELNHVPLIIKMPHSAGAGRRVSRMVGHVDIAPTLLEFAGAEPPPGLDGESFLPLLVDPQAELEPRTRFIEYLGMVGVRTERWKYISMRGQEPLLYDLSVDPGEQHNCAEQYPEIARQLEAAVQYARDERSQGTVERVVLDAETVESLHALGYL